MAKILLGVSAGIAAYKTPELVRGLVRAGHEVRVVCTPGALEFVSELSLSVVSGSPVRHQLLDLQAEMSMGHIELADWAELVLVAPASADLLARMANGQANDLLTAVLLATRAAVHVAPAMNVNMWEHPATQANLALLERRGVSLVGPEAGALACGWEGLGRMSEPAAIVDSVASALSHRASLRWQGQSVLVTAGPTRCYLDPVRFITNASSGSMGFELAAAFARAGADVELVAGPVSLATPAGVRRHDVETASEMLESCTRILGTKPIRCVAKVAAVSDVRLAGSRDARDVAKVSKEELLQGFSAANFAEEEDLLATLVRRANADTRFLGFAAQTLEQSEHGQAAQLNDASSEALVQLGRTKAERKGCDAIFVNRVGVSGSGFSSDTNAGVLLLGDRRADDAKTRWLRESFFHEPQAKAKLAEALVEELAAAYLRGGEA